MYAFNHLNIINNVNIHICEPREHFFYVSGGLFISTYVEYASIASHGIEQLNAIILVLMTYYNILYEINLIPVSIASK